MKNSVIKNAGWIIGCKVVKAILTLVITMISARILGVANYGLMSYAIGIVAFVAPIMKLGLDAISVREIVYHPEKEGQTVGSILCLCFVSSLICILGILAFTLVANHDEPVTIVVCLLYGFVLIFQAIEMLQYWFQAKLLSKYSAIAMLVSYIVVTVVQTILLINQVHIFWFAISYCLDFLVIDAILLVVFNKKSDQKLSFSWARSKEMLAVSRFYIISGLMITVFNNTDRIMIKLMISDTAAGIYTAAHTCAGMASFVFVAIIDSMRSTIFESKKVSTNQYEKNMVGLYSIIIYFSLLQCVVMTVLSPIIIQIMYGDEYHDAIDVLRIAVWFSTFSYLGTVRDIWILSEGLQRLLWKINLSGALMNVFLNSFMIPIWGPCGAALASVISQFFTNVVTGLFIKSLKRNNQLMLTGLRPSSFISVVSKVIKRRASS